MSTGVRMETRGGRGVILSYGTWKWTSMCGRGYRKGFCLFHLTLDTVNYIYSLWPYSRMEFGKGRRRASPTRALKQNTAPSLRSFRLPICHQLLPTLSTNDSSVPTCGFVFYRKAYKWSHTICSLVDMASCSWHDVFEIHPCYANQVHSFQLLSNIALNGRLAVDQFTI